jgi:hypothetical protein
MGAAVDPLLARAGISAELLEHPGAAVPLENAFRFAELACRAAGTEHLALHLGISMSLEDLGPYGKLLQRSLTLHGCIQLHTGIPQEDRGIAADLQRQYGEYLAAQ